MLSTILHVLQYDTLMRNQVYIHRAGNTPLVPVALSPGDVPIYCKCEFMLPSGSTKDRIASFILHKAWRAGELHPGMWVVEASSGSTSIALALACAQMGFRFQAVLPEGVSDERVKLIRAYGGEVRFTPKAGGIRAAIQEASKLADERKGFATRQFANPDNSLAHATHTASEILSQVPGGVVHAVVSGVGTGGTLVGLYQGLKQAGCPVIPFAAKPIISETKLYEVECCSFSTKVPGVVDGLSELYRPEVLPGLVELEVHDNSVLHCTKQLHLAGFPVGPSSGLNYLAAQQAAKRLPKDSVLVTVLPDRVERYFSTELFH